MKTSFFAQRRRDAENGKKKLKIIVRVFKKLNGINLSGYVSFIIAFLCVSASLREIMHF